jgi:hypothetical protein
MMHALRSDFTIAYGNQKAKSATAAYDINWGMICNTKTWQIDIFLCFLLHEFMATNREFIAFKWSFSSLNDCLLLFWPSKAIDLFRMLSCWVSVILLAYKQTLIADVSSIKNSFESTKPSWSVDAESLKTVSWAHAKLFKLNMLSIWFQFEQAFNCRDKFDKYFNLFNNDASTFFNSFVMESDFHHSAGRERNIFVILCHRITSDLQLK